MILLVAATLTVSPPASPVRALVEARATARIISGARLDWKQGRSDGGLRARNSVVTVEGAQRQAQLIEFE